MSAKGRPKMANSVRSLGLTQLVCDKPTRAKLKMLAENSGITLVELLRQVAATYEQMPSLVARSKTLTQIEDMSNIEKIISFTANSLHIEKLDTGIRQKGQRVWDEGVKMWSTIFGNDPKAEEKGFLLARHYELLKDS